MNRYAGGRRAFDHPPNVFRFVALGALGIVGLLYLDLDGFKPVNDRFGHAAGDFILRETAARIRVRIREEDTAARLGGDEFCIVADKLHGTEDAVKLAESLLAAIHEPLVWEGEEIRISGSFGIALSPEHGELAEVLLDRADEAMYAAKTEGRNRVHVGTTARGGPPA